MVNLLTPGELERSRKVYQQLGLQDFASADEIKRAYRNLALLNHPDKNQSDPDAINRFRLINEAYQILSDETKRKKYDAALQSAYSASQLFGGFPTSARQAAATTTTNTTATHSNTSSSSYSAAAADLHHHHHHHPDVHTAAGGAVPTPQQFRDQMNAIPKRRHPSAHSGLNNNSHHHNGSSTNNNNNFSPTSPLPTNGPTSTIHNTFSSEQNEEYKRKEKARFAEMKRRLETERAQQQELELQRLQKQQNEQRREQQRRQREQERIRDKLDKALQGGGGIGATGTPFQRVGSSQNVGNSSSHGNGGSSSTPLFRSASSNNNNNGPRGMNNKSLNLTGSANVASPSRNPATLINGNPIRSRSANSHALLPDYSANNINNLQNTSTIAGAHTHSKHTTFATSFGARRSMSPLGSPSGSPRKRVQLQETNANTPRGVGANEGDRDFLDDVTGTAATTTPLPSFASPRKRPIDSTNASPEMIELTRKQIERDLENLPIEENEEREHFHKLQERHERALMISKFKQEALIIETEVRFRDFNDAETSSRYAIDCDAVVERSSIQIEHQCFVRMHELMTEASRQGRGIFAWHENIWAHMKQNMARLMLISEREELQRSAVIEEQEKRESASFHIHGAALSRKFRLSTFEEVSARQTLYTNFFVGARMIEASRKMIHEHMQVMNREEALARERLTVELEETRQRGSLLSAHSERYDFIVHSRTTAISSYINELNNTILSMTDKITNHERIVNGMKDAIEMHKQDNAREREQHESQLAMMRGDVEALESQVSKLRKDLLSAEEKNIDEVTKYEKLMDEKKQVEKKFAEVRLTVAMEYEEEMKKVKQAAQKQDEERLSQIREDKEKHDALAEKFDKLKGKHAEAADFLKEMMERDEKQREEIERLRKEVMMMRDLDSAENGETEQIIVDANNNNNDIQKNNDEPDETRSDQSGSQVSVFEVGSSGTNPPAVKQQQQQQQQKSPSSTTTATKKPATLNSNGLNQTPSAASQQVNNKSTPRASNQQISATPTTTVATSESPDSSIANRHTRSARLEHRLYTAAAAATAASIAMAQREGGNSSNMIKSRNALNSSLMNNNSNVGGTPPRQISGGSNQPSSTSSTPTHPQNNNNNASSTKQQQQSTPPPPPGRPPLSPSASSSSSKQQQPSSSSSLSTTPLNSARNHQSSSSKPMIVNSTATTQPSSSTTTTPIDPKASYRELSNQARPRTLRQVVDWEMDDAAAVAQRAAVASFLQKQQNALLHLADYSDDPRNAEIHVRSPVPGKGILEYAGIKDSSGSSSNTNRQAHHQDPSNAAAKNTSSSDSCTSCEINNGAVSRLVATTDKLLLRNTSLVDDNETLAHAVVAMNQQREKNASSSVVKK